MQELGENLANGSDVDLMRHQLRQRMTPSAGICTEFRQREADRTVQVTASAPTRCAAAWKSWSARRANCTASLADEKAAVAARLS